MRSKILTQSGVTVNTHKPHGFKTVHLDGLGWRLLPAGVYVDAYARSTQGTEHMRVRAHGRGDLILEDFYFTSARTCNRAIDRAINKLLDSEPCELPPVRKNRFATGLDFEHYVKIYDTEQEILDDLQVLYGPAVTLSPSHQYMADLVTKYKVVKKSKTLGDVTSHQFGVMERTGVMGITTALMLRASTRCRRSEFYKHLVQLYLHPSTAPGLPGAFAEYRIVNGLNANQLSVLIDTHPNTIYTLERGTRVPDTVEINNIITYIQKHTRMSTSDQNTIGKQKLLALVNYLQGL